ncbi:MAG: hypothetical protein ACRDND_12880 [Streptosporangiaceae bacterium]
MPSSAVPNTDLPDPDLPDTETGSGPADDAWGASATRLRCDGCGASVVIDQEEHQYGGLVHSFLGHHSRCGNAVQITRIQPGET